MFEKKQKPALKYVMVKGTNSKGECFFKHIPIPEGGRFEYSYADHPTVYDKHGRVIRKYDWQWGFTIEYEFFYEGDEQDAEIKAQLREPMYTGLKEE